MSEPAAKTNPTDGRTDRQQCPGAGTRHGQGGSALCCHSTGVDEEDLEKKSEGWEHGNLGMSARAAGSAQSRRGSGDARFPPVSLGQLGSLSISWSPGAGISWLGSSQSWVLMLKVVAPKLCLLGGSLSSEGWMLQELDLAVSPSRDTEGSGDGRKLHLLNTQKISAGEELAWLVPRKTGGAQQGPKSTSREEQEVPVPQQTEIRALPPISAQHP
ncbi:hypothetical protein TURU_128728 [Turdus rufiventris]|nr:hypothetical protein TURU_128728 [Turdus rufiventris]